MRIAILAHVRQPIAQPFAGGMEAHCWQLATGLIARGHDVTLFASGDSDPALPVAPVIARHYDADYTWADFHGTPELYAYLDVAYAKACEEIAAGGFDVVHNNSMHRFPLERKWTDRTPTVTSLHVPPFDAIHHFVVAGVTPRHRLTVTSQPQARAWFPDGVPDSVSILHNGIDPQRWAYHPTGNGEAVWCGRITPNKGTHLAMRAARLAGVRITLIGPIEDPDYWAAEVEPWLGDEVSYGGHLEAAELARAMGAASVLVFTPCWDEPFGLVAAEAMACGLPVAAFDRGAAREVIAEAGAFAPADDTAALADAIGEAMAIDRRIPRGRVMAHFTQDRWLDKCEALYREAIAAARPDLAMAAA